MRWLFIVLVSLFVACPEPDSPPSAILDLTVAATRPAPRIRLAPVPLATQADFDALEDRLRGRQKPAHLIAALERLAAKADPAAHPEDVLLLMRLAVLYRDHDPGRSKEGEPGRLKDALALGTRLRDHAPASPHTLFLQGYIPYTFLGGSSDRQLVLGPESREFATVVREQWRILLLADPRYDGPHDYDHERIARIIADIGRALEVLSSEVERPPKGEGVAVVERWEVEVLDTLSRFEASSEGDRKVICRDWESGGARGESDTPSASVLRLDLACATLAGDVAVAVPLIVQLGELEGPAFDSCHAVARLGDRGDPKALAAAVAATELRCP